MLQKKGGFPADVRADLNRERVVLMAEGIPGTLSAPRRTATIAALAITQQRLAVYALGQPLIDATWDSGDARDVDITVEEKGVRFAFAADPDTVERHELVLSIGDGAALLAAIDQRRRELPPRQRLADRED
jgi:hypothetical protein